MIGGKARESLVTVVTAAKLIGRMKKMELYHV